MRKETTKPFAGHKEEWLCRQIEELYARIQAPLGADEITYARLYGTFLGTMGTLREQSEPGEAVRIALSEMVSAVQEIPKGAKWRYEFACSAIDAVLARVSGQLREGISLEALRSLPAPRPLARHSAAEVQTLLSAGGIR